MDFATLEDGTFAGRTVGLRVDINSPVDAAGTPTDDSRFLAHLETIETLLERDAAVAILAHQGRPGREDFASLEAHADHLDDLVSAPVDFVDAVHSADARRAVASIEPGSACCLENTRFSSEELLDLDPVDPAPTHLVRRLSSVLDCYVNDAFAVSHRSQASIVGFPAVLPSYAGRLMSTEVGVLGDLTSTQTPRVALLAGAKVDDSIQVARRLLDDDLVDQVYVGGVVANLLLIAAGVDPGQPTRDDVADRGFEGLLTAATELYERHGDRINLPRDVVIPDGDGTRIESVGAFPIDGVPRDLGPDTIDDWSAELAGAGTVICNGPVGRFEDERFAAGTAGLFEAAGRAAYAIAGGGDTSAAIRHLDIEGFDHVSTGGGAAVTMLSGGELPGLTALAACDIEPAT